MSTYIDVHADATNFHDILVFRAKNQPDTIVYRFHDSENEEPEIFTYAKLLNRVSNVVAALGTTVKRGDRALISMPSCPEFVIAFFACQALGVIAVPVPEPKRGRLDERMENILSDAKPAILLTLASIGERLDQDSGERLADMPRLAIDTVSAVSGHEQPALLPIDKDAIAFLQYTSGSTGDPKGVCVSNGNLLDNSRLMSQAILPSGNRIGVSWLPLFHDMGLIGGVLQPMYSDIDSTILKPTTFLMRPTVWLQFMSDCQATIAVAPNFALDLCVDKCSDELLEKLDLSAIRVLMCGAEPVQASTVERFIGKFAGAGFDSAAICPVYGLAEATLFVSGGVKSKPFEGHHYPRDQIAVVGWQVSPSSPNDTSVELVACGPVVPGTVIVHPDTGAQLSEGTVGEIWASGDSVCSGYWQRPEKSADTFSNVLRGAADNLSTRYLRTGDLGFIQSGQLYVTGRIKDLIIVRGRNIYPQDVEHLVSSALPELVTGAAAAFMAPVNGSEEMVVLAEVSREGSRSLKEVSEQERVLQSIRETVLVQTGVALGAVHFLKPGRLLRTTSGKVRRSANRDSFMSGEVASIASWQSSQQPESVLANDDEDSLPKLHTRKEFEQWIVQRLAERCSLRASDIALDQPFVNFGLDSLAAVEMVQALQRRSGATVALDATTLWDYPTISSLVDYLCSEPRSNNDAPTGVVNGHVIVDTAIIGSSSNDEPLDAAEEIRRLEQLLG